MDKYYSKRHKRSVKSHNKKENKKDRSSFILRLNICLGLAIIGVGAYKMKDGFAESIETYLKTNTSAETIKDTAINIKDFVIEAKGINFTDRDEFVPDESTKEYIENYNKNSYYNLQKEKEDADEKWGKPVEGGVVTDVFGNRNNPVTGKNENHKGLDIGVPMNTEAKAVKSGVVTDKGYSDSYGNWVKYVTYDGYEILYAHLSSVKAEKNQKVNKGDVIAYTGNTGNSTGPHIHYEIKENNEYLDPYDYYMEGENVIA